MIVLNEFGQDYIKKLETRFWAKTQVNGDCLEWTGAISSSGYGTIGVGRSSLKSHRVAFELVNGYLPPDAYVCHRCDNPRCVKPDHLFLGTAKDNIQDCVRKNRRNTPKGADSSRARLTESDVVGIRLKHSAGQTQRSLANEYSVGLSAIKHILHGRSWRHVETQASLRGVGKGEANPASKLTTEQVKEIRELHGQGVTRKSIAAMYAVSRTMIGLIVNRQAWSHVE